MLGAAVSFLVVLTVSATELSTRLHWNSITTIVNPNSITPVIVTVGSLSEGSLLGLEVTLKTDTTENTTVFFTTVFHGELHSWSLDTARERNVTKYLCGLNQTQAEVRDI